MKIGIVSFYNSQDNYGQILQCFALQAFLKKQGHSVFHLQHNVTTKTSFLHRLIKILYCLACGDFSPIQNKFKKQENKAIKKVVAENKIIDKDRGFDYFRKKYLSFSKEVYSSIEELNNFDEGVDAWIAGSDQIWYAPSYLYYLQFAKKGEKVLSYAASMGGVHPDKYNSLLLKRYLKKFDFISLREEDGVRECIKLGFRNSKLAMDPTLLLDADDYRKISTNPNHTKPYLLIYLLGNPIGIDISEIFKWANMNNLDVKYVASQGRTDDFKKEYPSPNEWIGLIDNAQYVITNSFHGMVFSIILRKKFLVLPIVGEWSRMNGRVYTTLRNLSITDKRIFKGDFDVIKKDVDFDNAHRLIIAKMEEVLSGLKKVLG
ncbi:MAG: polysaccharide pyruvyl transferase family protein [Muribaculum sp.]|nr:polysaccharide pyruvyl transferase family protein [Muribaculum sp.]